jgi:MraZ protein
VISTGELWSFAAVPLLEVQFRYIGHLHKKTKRFLYTLLFWDCIQKKSGYLSHIRLIGGSDSMEDPFFLGTYPLTIDSKNRLLVPSKVRKLITPELGETLIVTRRDKSLWMYPLKYYRERFIRRQVILDIKPTPEMRKYLLLRVALSAEVEWDGQGRVVLPGDLLRDAGITTEVTLIGLVDHLELWSREHWLSQAEDVVAGESEIEEKFTPARLDATPEQ